MLDPICGTRSPSSLLLEDEGKLVQLNKPEFHSLLLWNFWHLANSLPPYEVQEIFDIINVSYLSHRLIIRNAKIFDDTESVIKGVFFVQLCSIKIEKNSPLFALF